MSTVSPEEVVQAQLNAYNNRDIDRLMATYADDAQQFEFPSTLLAKGSPEIRQRFLLRFNEPNLHAKLKNRTILGDRVIDHETVTRTFPEGTGTIELIAIYEVQGGRIIKAWFLSGLKKMD